MDSLPLTSREDSMQKPISLSPSPYCFCTFVILFLLATLPRSSYGAPLNPSVILGQSLFDSPESSVPMEASSHTQGPVLEPSRALNHHQKLHFPWPFESVAMVRPSPRKMSPIMVSMNHHLRQRSDGPSGAMAEVQQGFMYDMQQQKDTEEHLHPQTFFEISTPLDPPPHTPCSSLHVFQHSFANTFNLPPAMANYTPPLVESCTSPSDWSLIVLKWSGSSIGRQYDRIAGVWFGGVELLRTCTAEPTKKGIVWEVKKDVTKYASVLAKPQPIVVELANLVDSTFTGIFHINITLDFFSASHHVKNSRSFHAPADLIFPISSPSPLAGGYWFQIANDSYVPERSFSVPANVCKAILEVYLSFHGDDEFWYTNPPNEYIRSNNLTGVAGNGPFREVQAFLDDKLVGAIWPFPVVYTGGIINLYWRPAAAIGAFNLPTYEFDLTPFVGSLTDGNEHTVGMRVENALGYWLVDGCLHLWLDTSMTQTSGKLLSYNAPARTSSQISAFRGLDGTFHMEARRSVSYSGFVVSSKGNLSVSSSYALEYDNVLSYANDSVLQTVSQRIHSNGEITVDGPSGVLLFQESSYAFPLDLSCLMYEGANKSSVVDCNFTHAFNEKKATLAGSGSSFSLLKNRQEGEGVITVANGIVVAGLGALQQQYSSVGSTGCYSRVLSTRNSTVLSDSTSRTCNASSS